MESTLVGSADRIGSNSLPWSVKTQGIQTPTDPRQSQS
jgi:hypothetical protein